MSYVENLERRQQQLQEILERVRCSIFPRGRFTLFIVALQYATPQEIATELGFDLPEVEAPHVDCRDLGQPSSEPSIVAVLPAFVDSLRRSRSPDSIVKYEPVENEDFAWDDLSEEMQRLTMEQGYSHRVYGKSSGEHRSL